MGKFTSGQIGAAIGIGVASLAIRGEDLPIMDWRDYTAFLVLGLLLLWLLKPNTRVNADGHQGTRKSLAFRLGKTLNRVRGSFRS